MLSHLYNALIRRIQHGFDEVTEAIKALDRKQDIRVIVQLDTSVQKEILKNTEAILEKLSSGGGLSHEEEEALAVKLRSSSESLGAAVEANQPSTLSTKRAKRGEKSNA